MKSLIVTEDYPFLPTNHPYLLEWLKEYNGFVLSPSSYIIDNQLEDELDWFENFKCAIATGIVRKINKERKQK